jgi:hypothetical protein
VPNFSGDFNNDGKTDVVDLSTLASYYGKAANPVTGDTSGDGIVTILDLSTLASHWGQ